MMLEILILTRIIWAILRTCVPVEMYYCSRLKHQVCDVALDVFTYHLCQSILS
jgi:hypothetical protein